MSVSLRVCLVAGILLALAACASNDKPAYVERPAEDIYGEAKEAMDKKKYESASKLFDEVERQHPYSELATKSQLMAAYASYQDMKYEDAILALERFIELHPGHEDVPYAYYMRALCYYEQISDVRRDQKMTELALFNLEEVVRRFPDSKYARDAKLKIDLTRDHLAGKEMEIGRWYLRREQYNAAINRFRTVVEQYQTTSHIPEALHRLVEAYLALGITAEAQSAAAVLGHNYPGSSWYTDSYALLVDANVRPKMDSKSWLGKIWNNVI
ncbi:MAG: outer membrane protein assembly factor BamD [Pseudomonadota bacterium]|nr:outer membrane protein assembly factor BamD [Pseudomonadota bacterium]